MSTVPRWPTPTGAMPRSATPPCRSVTSGLDPRGVWAARAAASSACKRTTRGCSPAATSAACAAAKRDEFCAGAEKVVGERPELLSGDQEATLSFRGATAGLDPADGPFLIVDIGGGSTEFAVGTSEPEGVVSVDLGCVRLTEKFLHSDPPEPEELSQAVSVVRDELEEVARQIPATREAKRLVGLAGTITTIAAVELGLPHYDSERIHHFVLTHAAAEDGFRTLATESRAQRIQNPGLEAARADGPCLAGARAAGARIVGKVNLHELACGVTGLNPWFGNPVNPLDPSLVPGGSSSGSAVVVATDEADVAYGSDTGGSVRIPSACCGTTGLKTTWGRISLEGVWPLAPMLDTIGPMARDMAGVILGMQLLEPGFEPAGTGAVSLGRLRLNADPAIDAAIDAAVGACG